MADKHKNKWTVAIRPTKGGRFRKITKIIGLNGAGFSVLSPYHSAKQGIVLKQAVVPEMHQKAGKTTIPWSQVAAFTADDRVKLTYHPDGFVQFSGENPHRIISGRDPHTGEPKGMGIMARPFSNPSQSGPSVGISAWGLQEFEPAEKTDTLITFEPEDFYYRLDRPSDANNWYLAIYVFPTKAVPPVRYDGEQSFMDFALTFPGIAGVPGTIVRLKTIRLEKDDQHDSRTNEVDSHAGRGFACCQCGKAAGRTKPRGAARSGGSTRSKNRCLHDDEY
jgi:hypothetical protein